MPGASTNRLAWIDWMRGLACILMFQTHCYDSWLGGDARKSTFLMYSQLLGTLPAPLFLFLAGISLVLIIDKLLRKNVSAKELTRTLLRRGSQIFAFAFLFRLQEYLIAWGWAPWSDLFKVDVLNTIGISMILMALVCGIALRIARRPDRRRPSLLIAGVLGMSLIALLTPPLWTSWRASWLPWPIESYIDGAHNLSAPQPGLFPIFPWTGFAFAGLAAGLVLFSDWGRARMVQTLAVSAVAGVGLIAGARWIDHMPFQFYSVYDYWHTSPNFFVMRVGLLLIVALLSYAWCRWGPGARGFSPLIQLGQTSLLVYWVHLEFVYGRASLLVKRSNDVRTASLGLLMIFLMMLALSLLRTRVNWKDLGDSLRTRLVPAKPSA